MFIHTLTFLNISKSSPTKTYLAYLIPNLSFIIQSSCTHFSLKMQYMNCASTLLRLSLSIFLSPSVSVSVPVPRSHYHFIIYVFVKAFFCCFFMGGFYFLNIWYKSFLLSFSSPSSLPSFSLAFSHSEVLASAHWSLRAAYWLVQSSPPTPPPPLAHLPTIAFSFLYFFSLFKLFIVLWGYCHSMHCYIKENKERDLACCKKDTTEWVNKCDIVKIKHQSWWLGWVSLEIKCSNGEIQHWWTLFYDFDLVPLVNLSNVTIQSLWIHLQELVKNTFFI